MDMKRLDEARKIICGYGIGSERNLEWWVEMEDVLRHHMNEQPSVGLPPRQPELTPKFSMNQRVLIDEQKHGQGRFHPYGARVWMVTGVEEFNGRLMYTLKLDAQENADIYTHELTRRRAKCEETEIFALPKEVQRDAGEDGDGYTIAETKMESSNIDSINFQPYSNDDVRNDTGTLRVKFSNGGVYDYKDVPFEIAEGLRTASSPGGFFHAHIKGSFKFDKVD